MAWYATLFPQVYESPIGAKILGALKKSVETGDLRKTYLCDLSIRQFERVAASGADDLELVSAIDGVLTALEAINYPLTAEDKVLLQDIFRRNGFEWTDSP